MVWDGFALKWTGKIIVLVIALVIAVTGLIAVKVATADVTYGGSLNCDTNAMVYCGARSATELVAKYNNGDGRNTVGSVHDMYSALGISSAAVQTMPTTAQLGVVTSSGDVCLGDTCTATSKVATNATTGGRENMPGSTAVTYGNTTFYERSPGVSFQSSALTAYVVMNSNKQFEFAVIASCGNAVKAVPVAPAPAPTPKPTPAPAPTTPNYSIQKMVAKHGSSDFGSEIQVSPNTDVDFKIIVASTGSAAVQQLVVTDVLPSDLTYVNTPQDTLMRDGQAESSDNVKAFFGSGLHIDSLSAGTTTTFTFEALAGANQVNDNCSPETLQNVSKMTATALPAENATASVSIVCTPKATPAAVVTKVVTPPATPAVTVLPSTGAGSVAGIFVGVSVAGAAGYHWILRRRLSR